MLNYQIKIHKLFKNESGIDFSTSRSEFCWHLQINPIKNITQTEYAVEKQGKTMCNTRGPWATACSSE